MNKPQDLIFILLKDQTLIILYCHDANPPTSKDLP